jgi:hypothetical protein
MSAETIQVGDRVRLVRGREVVITAIFERWQGLYQVDNAFIVFRHEFQPLKWLSDIIGNTGIGVCAKNGSEEMKP